MSWSQKHCYWQFSAPSIFYRGRVFLTFLRSTIKTNSKDETINHSNIYFTAQKMKFSIKDFFSKWDQIRRKLRIWSHLVKQSLMENFIFCAVFAIWFTMVSERNFVKLYNARKFNLPCSIELLHYKELP